MSFKEIQSEIKPSYNSANSDITNTPPQSTNSGSCNSHILSQKENKKIVFNVFRNHIFSYSHISKFS